MDSPFASITTRDTMPLGPFGVCPRSLLGINIPLRNCFTPSSLLGELNFGHVSNNKRSNVILLVAKIVNPLLNTNFNYTVQLIYCYMLSLHGGTAATAKMLLAVALKKPSKFVTVILCM